MRSKSCHWHSCCSQCLTECLKGQLWRHDKGRTSANQAAVIGQDIVGQTAAKQLLRSTPACSSPAVNISAQQTYHTSITCVHPYTVQLLVHNKRKGKHPGIPSMLPTPACCVASNRINIYTSLQAAWKNAYAGVWQYSAALQPSSPAVTTKSATTLTPNSCGLLLRRAWKIQLPPGLLKPPDPAASLSNATRSLDTCSSCRSAGEHSSSTANTIKML